MLDTPTVGRLAEKSLISACIEAHKNVLLEGPVGVGKTHLALDIAQDLKRKVFRIDGDSRYTEQKLAGWFDPPTVLKKGYIQDAFIPGPLVQAMQSGGVLLINELNRLPEGVQNILLPAIDEKRVDIPHFGAIEAKKGFVVIATQNPKEFVATSHLSEAILDRFELVQLGYQSFEEEFEIVQKATKEKDPRAQLSLWSVKLIRVTREDSRFRRGASIRAALSLVSIAQNLSQKSTKKDLREAFVDAAVLALPSRIEVQWDEDAAQGGANDVQSLMRELALLVCEGKLEPQKKKGS